LFLKGEIVDYSRYLSYNMNFETKKDELSNVINLFEKLSKSKGKEYNLYIHYYSSALLDNFSYHACKVYVPALHKLWLREDRATPWSSRLIRFALDKGRSEFDKSHINIYPHPFP
jgi:Asp-tRNA(Asn)/Glu-tRNA(Gln) amidotransferase C subunit